jgi:PhnB protein
MIVQPYLMFEGRCEEALEFYRSALGAETVALMRYSEMPTGDGCDAPPMSMPPQKVMHSAVRIGDTTVFASDGMCSGQPKFEGISLSLSVSTDAEAARLFDALATGGGQIRQPLTKTFFASSFGMVADRFGLTWMILTEPEAR